MGETDVQNSDWPSYVGQGNWVGGVYAPAKFGESSTYVPPLLDIHATSANDSTAYTPLQNSNTAGYAVSSSAATEPVAHTSSPAQPTPPWTTADSTNHALPVLDSPVSDTDSPTLTSANSNVVQFSDLAGTASYTQSSPTVAEELRRMNEQLGRILVENENLRQDNAELKAEVRLLRNHLMGRSVNQNVSTQDTVYSAQELLTSGQESEPLSVTVADDQLTGEPLGATEPTTEVAPGTVSNSSSPLQADGIDQERRNLNASATTTTVLFQFTGVSPQASVLGPTVNGFKNAFKDSTRDGDGITFDTTPNGPYALVTFPGCPEDAGNYIAAELAGTAKGGVTINWGTYSGPSSTSLNEVVPRAMQNLKARSSMSAGEMVAS